MQIIIEEQGNCCAIIAADLATTTTFPLNITGDALRQGLRTILAAPEAKDYTIPDGPSFVRQPDGITVVTVAGRFAIPYPHAFPLVL